MKRGLTILFIVLSTGLFAAQNPAVVMQTSMGTIEIELYPGRAPDKK